VTSNLPFDEWTEVFGSERRVTGGRTYWLGLSVPGAPRNPRVVHPGIGDKASGLTAPLSSRFIETHYYSPHRAYPF